MVRHDRTSWFDTTEHHGSTSQNSMVQHHRTAWFNITEHHGSTPQNNHLCVYSFRVLLSTLKEKRRFTFQWLNHRRLLYLLIRRKSVNCWQCRMCRHLSRLFLRIIVQPGLTTDTPLCMLRYRCQLMRVNFR